MIGKKINRYRITEKIGEGGMGSVWRAEDPLLGRDIALKFLPESLARSADARKRFLREAKAASTLEHNGIATVFDAGEVDGRIYIAFQLVDGETVSERIGRGPLDVTDACRVAFDAAEALDHAHARGVLHRDVTSRNIMIDNEGRVIVVDFGLALPHGATRVTERGSAVGTAPYLAPEVVKGDEGDVRADVYGLGVVLYEALTGTLPFDAERTESLFYLIMNTEAEPPSAKREGIPPELDRIVMKALSKDPAERYASAREFAKDLHAVLETVSEQPPSARWLTAPPPTARRDGRFKQLARKPISWVVATTIVAMAVVGLWRLGVFDRGDGESQPAFSSVAVLPFRNLSDNPGQNDWLAEGLGETLTAKLTTVPGIRVSPWFTSRNHGDLSKPLAEIAADLNVEALVMGTVRQFGDQVKCTISVVDSKTGSQWWADEYKEPMDDLFGVQERITVGVAASIRGRLSGTEKEALGRPSASSIEAYEQYVRGSLVMRQGTPEALGEALSMFEQSIALDPEFAKAYVGLGAVHDNLFYGGWGSGRRDLREAEDAFRHALEIDPTSTGARRGLVRVYWHLGRSEEILKQGEAALRTNPEGVENILAMGEAYVIGGLPEAGMPVLQRVIELDPANEAAHWFLVLGNLWAGRYDGAIAAGETYLHKFGEDGQLIQVTAIAYHSMGDYDAAEVYYARYFQLFGDRFSVPDFTRLMSAALFFDIGEEEKARALLSEGIASLERRFGEHRDHFRLRGFLAAMHGMRGDTTRLRELVAEVGGATALGNVVVAAVLARSGDIASAAEILEATASGGYNLRNDLRGYIALFPQDFLEHPDVQPAVRAMQKRYDDLASRY